MTSVQKAGSFKGAEDYLFFFGSIDDENVHHFIGQQLTGIANVYGGLWNSFETGVEV